MLQSFKIFNVIILIGMLMFLFGCNVSNADSSAQGSSLASTAATIPDQTEIVPYQVIVMNEKGNPVTGAMLQLCKDTLCIPAVTDINGVASFDVTPGSYKVSFLQIPEGYAFPDKNEFFFDVETNVLTITLTSTHS